MNAVGELVINRTRMLGRLTELAKLVEVLQFLEGAARRQSLRLPGKARIQPHSHVACAGQPALADGHVRRQLPVALPPITSNDLLEFSELEMDRYDDVNILSRSLTEISADVTEVLTQLEGFMGRVDSDIDEFTKLAHHLQDEITAARMVPIGNLYTRLSRTRPRRRESVRQTRGAFARRRGDRTRQQHHSAHFRSADSSGAQRRGARNRRRRNAPARRQIRKRATSRCAPTIAATTFSSKWKTMAAASTTNGVRQSVIESGEMSPVAAAELSERELREFLFRPGFSTASSMIRAGRPRRGPRRGALQRSRAERRNRSSLGSRAAARASP